MKSLINFLAMTVLIVGSWKVGYSFPDLSQHGITVCDANEFEAPAQVSVFDQNVDAFSINAIDHVDLTAFDLEDGADHAPLRAVSQMDRLGKQYAGIKRIKPGTYRNKVPLCSKHQGKRQDTIPIILFS